jgi:hypothetical protein
MACYRFRRLSPKLESEEAMIELPPLPEPDYHEAGFMAALSFSSEAMRSYGEACARAALDSSRYETWQLCGEAEFARVTDEGIQRIKLGGPASILFALALPRADRLSTPTAG